MDQTNRRDSTGYSLPEDIDEALEVICLVYARQGTPLTKEDFLVLARKMEKKDDDEVFSPIFFQQYSSPAQGDTAQDTWEDHIKNT